ncbi:MAG: HAD family hydrolase [Acholeplasmataceae bacterium]
MIKGIIFDMDGTILNTIEDIKISVNHAMRHFNLKEKTLQEVKDGVGSGAVNLIEDIVPKGTSKEDIFKIYRVYQDHYDKHSNDHTGPYPGILDLLKHLKDAGYKLAVVSNKLEYLVQELNHQTFKDYFDVSIGETKDIPIKPAPDMLYKALNLLNLSKDEVLFIGDSDVDMMTATNANIKSVGVTWGYRSKEVLLKHKASYIINQADELIKIINEVNSYGND